MDAVVLHTNYPERKVNGAIIDAFEYYLSILEYNKDIKLVIINSSRTYLAWLFDILENKYVLDDIKWKYNVIVIRYSRLLLQYNFNKILVLDYGTIKHTRGFLRCKKIIVLSDKHGEQVEMKPVDAIIYYRLPFVNGALIDAFEYYITMLDYNPSVKFIMMDSINGLGLKYILDMFENKYELDNIDWKKNIITISKSDLIKYKFNRVLILDSLTIYNTRGLLRVNKIYSISDNKTNTFQYMYNKNLYDVTYYGEMPFEYRDIEYKMKFAFNRYKPLRKVEPGIYINSPDNPDRSFLEKLDLPDKPLIFKAKLHLNNLFEQFDEYLYWHANTWFDPHPRLLLESAFYGKKIHYYNEPGVEDGSWYRYLDWKENGIENRTLDDNDEIVRLFL